MSVEKDIVKDFEKVKRYREKLLKKANRLLDIMDFLEYTFKTEYPDSYHSLLIDTSFFRDDLELIIKQKDIENYKNEMFDMADILSNSCSDVGLKKVSFIRKYKIWVVLKNKE